MSINIKINGLDKVYKKLQRLKSKVKKDLAKKATGTAAAIMRDESKRIVYTAPKEYRIYNKDGQGGKTSVIVSPGFVGRNIIMKRIPESELNGLTSKHIVTVSNSLEQPRGAKQIAIFIEFGINMTKAHPFMRTAYANKQGEAKRKAIKIVQKGVREEWKK